MSIGLSLRLRRTVGVFLAVCMWCIWTCPGHAGLTWYAEKWDALRRREPASMAGVPASPCAARATGRRRSWGACLAASRPGARGGRVRSGRGGSNVALSRVAVRVSMPRNSVVAFLKPPFLPSVRQTSQKDKYWSTQRDYSRCCMWLQSSLCGVD